MATDFLAQLRADLALLTTSQAAQNQALVQRATATKGIADSSKVARSILVLLNAAIVPALKTNQPLLAGWKAAKSVTTTTPLPPQPVGLAPATSATPVTPVAPATTPSAGSAPPPSSTPGTAAAAAPAVQTAKPAA